MRVDAKSPWKSAVTLFACLSVGLMAEGCGKNQSDDESSHEKSERHEASEDNSASTGPSKGVGPIHQVDLGSLDAALAIKGEKAFSGTCAACHKLDQRYVGPALAGVTKRRTAEWIMNMILNPSEMTQKDETAKALLGEYMTQMSVAVTQEDARAILEYFRKLDGG